MEFEPWATHIDKCGDLRIIPVRLTPYVVDEVDDARQELDDRIMRPLNRALLEVVIYEPAEEIALLAFFASAHQDMNDAMSWRTEGLSSRFRAPRTGQHHETETTLAAAVPVAPGAGSR